MTNESGASAPTPMAPELTQDHPGTGSVRSTSDAGLSSEEIGRLTDEIVAALKSVYDPEIPADVYDRHDVDHAQLPIRAGAAQHGGKCSGKRAGRRASDCQCGMGSALGPE